MGSFRKISFIITIFGLALAVLRLQTLIDSELRVINNVLPGLKNKRNGFIGKEYKQSSTQPVIENNKKIVDFAIAGKVDLILWFTSSLDCFEDGNFCLINISNLNWFLFILYTFLLAFFRIREVWDNNTYENSQHK